MDTMNAQTKNRIKHLLAVSTSLYDLYNTTDGELGHPQWMTTANECEQLAHKMWRDTGNEDVPTHELIYIVSE